MDSAKRILPLFWRIQLNNSVNSPYNLYSNLTVLIRISLIQVSYIEIALDITRVLPPIWSGGRPPEVALILTLALVLVLALVLGV